MLNTTIFNAEMNENCVPYRIVLPQAEKTGILLSIPHCGIEFPKEIKDNYKTDLIQHPDDTDSYLEKLYDFASSMGITVIQAVYSRWVIDLNRTPENSSLYSDGRIITSLCPTTNFFGDKIYTDQSLEPTSSEVEIRLNKYYYPYHNKIDEILVELKDEFKNVILWDAHSIRRKVETIQKEPFPDLILGNNDKKTASEKIIKAALATLKDSSFEVYHNHPFKGGYITRSKGKPTKNIHSLQLEMAKDLYMSNNETVYDSTKAQMIQKTLKQALTTLTNFTNERV